MTKRSTSGREQFNALLVIVFLSSTTFIVGLFVGVMLGVLL